MKPDFQLPVVKMNWASNAAQNRIVRNKSSRRWEVVSGITVEETFPPWSSNSFIFTGWIADFSGAGFPEKPGESDDAGPG